MFSTVSVPLAVHWKRVFGGGRVAQSGWSPMAADSLTARAGAEEGPEPVDTQDLRGLGEVRAPAPLVVDRLSLMLSILMLLL